MGYAFRAYCDICNEPSPWYNSKFRADEWRMLHWESLHSDNPMMKQNCRIQRERLEIMGDNNPYENAFDYQSDND